MSDWFCSTCFFLHHSTVYNHHSHHFSVYLPSLTPLYRLSTITHTTLPSINHHSHHSTVYQPSLTPLYRLPTILSALSAVTSLYHITTIILNTSPVFYRISTVSLPPLHISHHYPPSPTHRRGALYHLSQHHPSLPHLPQGRRLSRLSRGSWAACPCPARNACSLRSQWSTGTRQRTWQLG